MKSTKRLILMFMIIGLFAACEPNWIIDPVNSDLPKYTESGNDVAGALVNDLVWEAFLEGEFDLFSNDQENDPYILVDESDGEIELILPGQIGDENSTVISFTFKESSITQFEDLGLLHDKKIALDGTINEGHFSFSDISNPVTLSNGEGQLYIRNVSSSDDTSFVVSGTFGFTVTDPSYGTFEIFYGRFDLLIKQSDTDFRF